MKQTTTNSWARWSTRVAAFGLLWLTLGAVCGRDADRQGDSTVRRITADGDVIMDSTREYPGLKYSLDSEKYVKWVAAQRSLDAIPDLTVPTRVSLRNFTEDDVDQAADVLESNPRAKAAIKAADLSVKDFVRISVALEQLMATMTGARPARFRDLPPGNIDFVTREGDNFRRTFDARRVRVVGDDTDDRDSDGDSDKNKVRNRRDGKDSDNKDSDRKGKGRGKDSDSR